MTRIIGGSAGGRRLATPRGTSTRPSSDRVREALFSAIESWCGSLQGLRFLDLYAGSGAVGLEAWSRGAGRGHPRRAGPPHRRADHQQRQDPRLPQGERRRRPGGRDPRAAARGAVRRRVPRPALPDHRRRGRRQPRAAVGRVGGPRRHGRGRAVVPQPARRSGRRGSRRPASGSTARPPFGTVTPPTPADQEPVPKHAPEPSAPGRSTRSRWATSTSSGARRSCSTRS